MLRRGRADRVARAGAAPVPDALPAADAADHGQGRRGHGVLPLRAAARPVRRRRRPEPVLDRRRAVPRRQRRARGALPAPAALEHDARHEALGRRARADRRARRDGGRVGRRGAALARRCARRCASGGAPDAVEEHTIFQTLVGAWPIEPERLCAYMVKAMREAKRNTSWVEQDAGWEERVLAYCRGLYDARGAARGPRAVRRAASRRRESCTRCARRRSSSPCRACPTSTRATSWWRSRWSIPTTAARSTGRAGARCSARAPSDARHAQAVADPRAAGAARAPARRRSRARTTPLDAGADAVAFLRGDEVVVALPIRGAELDFAPPPGDWVAVVEPGARRDHGARALAHRHAQPLDLVVGEALEVPGRLDGLDVPGGVGRARADHVARPAWASPTS